MPVYWYFDKNVVASSSVFTLCLHFFCDMLKMSHKFFVVKSSNGFLITGREIALIFEFSISIGDSHRIY
jgi:hypothetical protein